MWRHKWLIKYINRIWSKSNVWVLLIQYAYLQIICFESRIQNKTTQKPAFLMYLVFGKDSSCGFNQFFRNFSQKSKFTHFHQTLLCMHCLNFCFMDILDVTSLYQNRFWFREKGMHYTSFWIDLSRETLIK